MKSFKHDAQNSGRKLLRYLSILVFCLMLAGCNVTLNAPGATAPGTDANCQTNCNMGTGANGLSVIVEPDAGVTPLVDAIHNAQKSVWLEIYLLTNKNIISALEDDANKGIDVRVMLEQHPFGGGSVSPSQTIDTLKSAGIKAQFTNPSFALTHEKGMVIDNTTAYIMTSNFTNSALGTGSGTKNREYDIVDNNASDVQAVAAIFQADWDRSTANFNDPDLVVSPVNSRNDFHSLISGASKTLLVEAEEMNDSAIEQDLVDAAKRGVQVQVILPAPSGSSKDSNKDGINTIKAGGVSVKEDKHLYMHAKIFVADGKQGFVGSENISTQSLDQNRELGIVISDSGVLGTLQQTFQTDWNDPKTVSV